MVSGETEADEGTLAHITLVGFNFNLLLLLWYCNAN
jgi:hypothetical protein